MDGFYTRTVWKDHFIDESGNVVQQGTPVDAHHLNNIEEGIVQLEADMTYADDELEEMLNEVLI